MVAGSITTTGILDYDAILIGSALRAAQASASWD